MKNLNLLCLAMLWSSLSIAQNSSLRFTDCADASDRTCQAEALQAIEAKIFKKAFKHFEYEFEDSLYFQIELNPEGAVSVSNSYAYFSPQLAAFVAEIIPSALKKKLQKPTTTESYQFSLVHKLSEPFNNYYSLEEAPKPVVMSNCKRFNDLGKQYCLGYLSELASFSLMKFNAKGEGRFEVFAEGLEVKAIRCDVPLLDKSRHDSIKVAFEEMLNGYIDLESAERSNPIIYTFEFSSFNSKHPKGGEPDSLAMYAYTEKELSMLQAEAPQAVFLKRLLERAEQYFPNQGAQRRAFVERYLVKAGLQDTKFLSFGGKTVAKDSLLSIIQQTPKDSLVNIEEVDRLPVFKGCDPTFDQETLMKCFTQMTKLFVYRNFVYPDLMRMLGISGQIYVRFVIEKDGHVDEIEVLQSPDIYFDFEAIKVVSQIPKFEAPAMKNNVPVRMAFVLPINASIQ